MRNTEKKGTIHHNGIEDTQNISASHKTQIGLLHHDGDIKQGLAHSHAAVRGNEGQEVAVSGTKDGEEEDGAVWYV